MIAPPEPAAAPPAAPQRRYLTVVFADLSDSTRLSEMMEAEHYAELLSELRALYQGVVAAHGGAIVRIQGDGMLAIFGYPQLRDDDARRATEALLDLHEAVAQLQPTLRLPRELAISVHSGVHAGLVLLDAGDMVRGRFELMGAAPNVAARLSAEARPGEILVSEETLGPHRQFFETDERRVLHVKGRQAPIPVYRIRGRAHSRGRTQGLTPFVGRQAELQTLQAALLASLAGRPRAVTVRASAGMGKSRLVEEFLRQAGSQACQVHRGYCERDQSAEPLQPFLQMLRHWVGLDHASSPADAAGAIAAAIEALDPGLLSLQRVLEHALALGAREGATTVAPEAIGAALRAVFEALLRRRPQLLFIDDLQWADDASRAVLNALQALPDCALLLVSTWRSDPAAQAPMPAQQLLDLAPLSDAEARAAIDRLLPGTDPLWRAEIERHAGGNPLFIEELCHSAAQEDAAKPFAGLPVAMQSGMHAGSAWLSALIESRVARLAEGEAALVRAAAVIGNVIPSWLLERVTGCGEHHPSVRALAEQDFIFPGQRAGELRFKHGITRDVIYEAVGLHLRRAMHGRIAELLRERSASGGQDESFEALAYHYGAAGQWQEAAHYAELAGDKALAASALDRAQQQYRAALAALDQLEPSAAIEQRWVAISQRFGLTCVFYAAPEDLAIFQRAMRLAQRGESASAKARSSYWLAYFSYALGAQREALAHGERAIAAAQACGDVPLLVQVRATLGQTCAAAADYGRALELLDEAITIQRRYRSASRPAVGLAYSLACRAYVQGDRGEFAAAHELFDEALALVRGSQHAVEASIQGWRGAVLLWQGRWLEAREAAQQAQRIGEQVRSLFTLSMGRSVDAYARWMLSHDASALPALLDATQWLATRGGALFSSFNHGWLADVYANLGDAAQVRHHGARALQRARQLDLLGVPMAYRALARCAAAHGQLDCVQRHLQHAARGAQQRSSAHELASTQLCAAQLAARRGDQAQSRTLAAQAAAGFESMRMDWHLEQARQLLV